MCVENSTIVNEDLIKKIAEEKNDIMDAVRIIKEFGPDIKMIHSMLKDHAKRIDEEVTERKEENKRITNNYLKRFDKVDNGINIMNHKIGGLRKKTNELKIHISDNLIKMTENQNKFLRNIMIIFLSCTVFLFITMVWEKLICYIQNIF